MVGCVLDASISSIKNCISNCRLEKQEHLNEAARLYLQAAHSNLPEAQYKVMNLSFCIVGS